MNIKDLPREYADHLSEIEKQAFNKSFEKLKEPYTAKDCECNSCCHHYVCGMCTTHKAENYSGCDFYMPYLRLAVPLTTYATETEFRNAWNLAVAETKSMQKVQAEYDTLENNVSGLIE